MTKTLRMLAGSIVVAMAPFAVAQTSGSVDSETHKLDTTAENHGETHVATRIAADFTTLAGSRDNALALVRALRNGTQVTLTTTSTGTTTGTTTGGTTSSVSFTPPTGKMGWGNVFISLALAQNSLAQLGITKPTSAQLQAALVGGSVTGADGTATTLKGVLTMRADGMGWGQIAQSLGTKLGPVVSAIKSTQAKIAKLPTTTASTTASTSSTTNKSTGATNTSASSKGLVTAAGVASTHGSHGPTSAGSASASPRGQGIVTAAGGSGAGVTAATSHGHGSGAGVVSANGANASGAVTNAAGSSGDNGKGHGKGRGGS
jgi:hypothetical protein